MHKTLLTALICCTSTSAFAAPIIDLKLGAGIWAATPSGDLGVTDTDVEEVLGLEEENATFVFAAFEHPIPVLPNVRLKLMDLQYDADTVLTETFTLEDQTFSVDADVLTDVDLSHTDITLYYGLPEFFLDVDFGLTVRSFDGEASVVSETAEITEQIDLDGSIPMAFADIRLDLPGTGLYFGAEANFLAVSDSSLTDYNVRVGYSTDVIPFLADLDVEVGYKSFALELDEEDFDVGADIEIDGPYVQVMLAF